MGGVRRGYVNEQEELCSRQRVGLVAFKGFDK